MRIPALLYLMKLSATQYILMLAVALAASLSAFSQTFTLKGMVTDDEGNPLELATVSCVEQQKIVFTNLL